MSKLRVAATRVLSIGLPIYVIALIFWPVPPLQERSIFILWMMLIHFLVRAEKLSGKFERFVNAAFAVATVVVFGYVALFHESIAESVGFPTTLELVFGVVAILLVLEATRQAMGLGLALVVVGFILYGLFGQLLPFRYGGHTGFGVDRIVNAAYLTTNGIFGIVVYTLYKYVFLFILFGNLLEATGALRFITDLAFALVGSVRGGPAMIAIVSSGLFGSVSGSAVANVAVTGSVTIPMMKKMGFEPHVAGAVEAAASNGGQLMPPVMGAGAFLMAQFLGISYLQVVKAAAFPAIIYYLAMACSIYFYSSRLNIAGMQKSEIPSLRNVLFSPDAFVFLGGLTSLIVFLVLRFSPNYAVLWSMVSMVVVSFIGKNYITPSKIVRVFESTPKAFLEVGLAGTGVGIVVAIVMLTGLAVRFSTIIVDLSGGSLMVTLVMTMLVSFVLGMGLPTTVCYLILATLLSPTLSALGVDPLAGHLFIFYAGIMSMVTPPVGLAAYAGASLAGANMWRTAWTATLLSLPAYLLPYIWVLDTSLILRSGDWSSVAVSLARGFVGCGAMSFALIGPSATRAETVRRTAAVSGGLLLIWPSYLADLLALLIFAAVFGPQLLRAARRGARPVPPGPDRLQALPADRGGAVPEGTDAG